MTGDSRRRPSPYSSKGRFRAFVASDGVHYELSYEGLEGGAIARRISIWANAIRWRIIVWLCLTLRVRLRPRRAVLPCPPARIEALLQR